MTDLRKAAEQSLDALETLWDILDDIDTASDMAKENDAWYRKRVEALQKKRWDTMITTDGHKLKGGPVEALRQALAQPEQEPMADNLIRTYVSAAMANNKNLVAEATKEMINYVCSFIENTAAPKREWVSLTDEEYDELLTGDWGGSLISRVEARLKEKNGG